MIKKKFRPFNLPAAVWIFGAVSFLTDVSSDMIYPLLPLFLVQYLGASQAFVGLIEGVAESTAAFFTLFSGLAADRVKDRSRLVLAGYTLSSFCRPFIALAQSPWVALLVRFSDRVGKGIRTSPRDALIADSVPESMRGRAYGLHRSMDHLGAFTGPALTALLLAFWIKDLRQLFLIAAIPGILSVALILWKVREIHSDRPRQSAVKFSLSLPHGKIRIYLSILFLFVLSCSSDAFLLLKASQSGVSNAALPLLWMTFNIVKSSTVFPFGALSDKIGRRRIILAGWLIYSAVYAGFAFASSPGHIWALFILYALFYGFTEGSERAILADYSAEGEKGRAFGWYYFMVGLGALPASLFFGWMWERFGARTAFLTSAGISLTAAMLLLAFLLRVPSVKKPAPAVPPAERD